MWEEVQGNESQFICLLNADAKDFAPYPSRDLDGSPQAQTFIHVVPSERARTAGSRKEFLPLYIAMEVLRPVSWQGLDFILWRN